MKTIKNSKVFMGMIIGIFVTSFVIFGYRFYKSTTVETEVILSDTSFEVKGAFGDTFNYDDITNIELKDTIPTIISKTNGSGLGDIKKGEFELENLGICQLYIHAEEGPFLYIKMNDNTYIIINYSESSKTEKLYQDLSTKISNKN